MSVKSKQILILNKKNAFLSGGVSQTRKYKEYRNDENVIIFLN